MLVVAKTNDDADILAATQYALDNKLGDVLSQSYGEAEQCVAPATSRSQQHQIFDALVAQGWTLFASSGDEARINRAAVRRSAVPGGELAGERSGCDRRWRDAARRDAGRS